MGLSIFGLDGDSYSINRLKQIRDKKMSDR